MADQMPADSLDLNEIRLKVNVLVLLIGTLLQSAKTGSVLTREDWLVTIRRVQQLLTLVSKPQFIKSLKEAHTTVVQEINPAEEDLSLESRNRFETERLVFPSLSNYAEGLHEQLWRSYQSLS